MHQKRGERRQHGHQQHADNARPALAVAAHEESEIRQHADGAGDHRRDGHGQRVAVSHMAELVRDHARQFFRSQPRHQSRCHAHGGVGWIAPGGKRVGLFILRDIDGGHGKSRLRRQLFDDVIKRRFAARIHPARAIHGEQHLVRVPVGQQVDARRHHKGDAHARPAADHGAHHQEQRHQRRHQDSGFQAVHFKCSESTFLM